MKYVHVERTIDVVHAPYSSNQSVAVSGGVGAESHKGNSEC